MNVTVRIEPEAEVQVDQLSAWWREHRQAAQSLKELLREVFSAIRALPHAAPVYAEIEGKMIRRRTIRKTPYAVFYYVDDDRKEAVVISVWSMQRGKKPPLR